MTKLNENRRPAEGRPPRLRKSTSSPSARTLREQPGPETFTEELQHRAARTRDLETTTVPDSERWMHVVIRRETLQHAVGRIVHVQRVGGEIRSTSQRNNENVGR
ncbi:hypothetical protein H2248_004450 [Termitomyces sp. 'cryptogamus']|nr:hypothetical protein H2248_004450 [Termitomyces sp. 'cryptogamus']